MHLSSVTTPAVAFEISVDRYVTGDHSHRSLRKWAVSLALAFRVSYYFRGFSGDRIYIQFSRTIGHGR